MEFFVPSVIFIAPNNIHCQIPNDGFFSWSVQSLKRCFGIWPKTLPLKFYSQLTIALVLFFFTCVWAFWRFHFGNSAELSFSIVYLWIGRTHVEAETPILWPPDAKSWLIWKDPEPGKDWEQEENGMTEDEMVGWHHQLNWHGFGWTPEVGDRQRGLVCCDS